jgi:DNA repair photolyase
MTAAISYQQQPFVYRGRGAQLQIANRFSATRYVQEYPEVLDEEPEADGRTEIIYSQTKSIINKVESSDIGMEYSANPYQGCEHGCVYCYARPTHEYWGYSAGVDFERKIIVKRFAAELIEKEITSTKWVVKPIMLSGNTDCYQPIEKKLEVTRSMLKVFLKYKHPVGIITKNALILRDMDILKELAKHDLVHVMISVTGMDEKVRQILEPRTSTYKNRINVIQKLTENGIPCGVMFAPVIPGLNNQDIPEVLRLAGLAGARSASYTMVRLNGAVGPVFKDWLLKHFPDRASKVWNQICDNHGGQVNDSRLGVRMRGQGQYSEQTRQIFQISKKRFITNNRPFEFNCEAFERKKEKPLQQMTLF